ncbi:MAG: methyltransferase domain-containing protein [Bacteroidetes bacterium]|nr:methyltransferase domain-containing protein [Bacteroidota bacterium]
MEILKRNLDTAQTQKNYRQVAWFYNIWSGLTESKAAKKVIQLADIQNGEHIIEIGCGTGVVFNEILKKNPQGINLGIDLSPNMLSRARKLLAKGATRNYELRQGDLFNLNIEEQGYDKLINNFMIDLMPEEKFDDILAIFYNLLKPNGVAIISTFSVGKGKINRFWGWLAKHFPKLLTDCRPVDIQNNIKRTGFEIEQEIDISQNSFPSKVYKLKKG